MDKRWLKVTPTATVGTHRHPEMWPTQSKGSTQEGTDVPTYNPFFGPMVPLTFRVSLVQFGYIYIWSFWVMSQLPSLASEYIVGHEGTGKPPLRCSLLIPSLTFACLIPHLHLITLSLRLPGPQHGKSVPVMWQ